MKKYKFIFLGIFSLLISSCSTDLSSVEESQIGRSQDYNLHWGRKLENPYSVKNMKQALLNVKQKLGQPQSKSGEDFSIETTHLYVKFNPQSLEEEKLLQEDSTIIVSDYPLDYDYSTAELEQMGYDNPDVIGSYYTAVPKDQPLPNIPKTILEELYIPEEDSYFEEVGDGTEDVVASKTELNNKNDLYANLMVEAYTLTNNESKLDIVSSADNKFWIFGSKWYPSGRITMFDNSLGNEVPVDGAQVLMRQWFTVRQGITDGNGNFSTGFVRGKAKYVLQWERYHYDIRNGTFGQAETHGPTVKKQPWYYSVNGGQNVQFAMIHRAAHHYYYKDVKGLTRPHMNGEMMNRMKIAAMNKTNDDINGDYNYWAGALSAGALPTIRIFKRDYCDEYYGTTIHELSHSAHFKLAPFLGFANISDKVAESWARGVQWQLSSMVYPSYNKDYINMPKYTLVVRDLIDNDNYFEKTGNYGEFTSGYTIKQIENSLKNVKTWQEWINKIKQDYENPTENNLDTVFNYWFLEQ